jgi:hypothetical protein
MQMLTAELASVDIRSSWKAERAAQYGLWFSLVY